MTPAELLVEVGEGGYETLVVRVVAAVLRLQLSPQLCLAVAHCPAKTNVLANLAIWVIILMSLMKMRMRRMRRMGMRIITVSSGGSEEVSRREVAEARCRGGGARVNCMIVISHDVDDDDDDGDGDDDDGDDDGDDDDDDDAHLESPCAAAELRNVGAA